MVGRLAVVGVAAGAWLWRRAGHDPREWPGWVAERWGELEEDIDAAIAAGRRAAQRRKEAIDRDLAEAESQEGR